MLKKSVDTLSGMGVNEQLGTECPPTPSSAHLSVHQPGHEPPERLRRERRRFRSASLQRRPMSQASRSRSHQKGDSRTGSWHRHRRSRDRMSGEPERSRSGSHGQEPAWAQGYDSVEEQVFEADVDGSEERGHSGSRNRSRGMGSRSRNQSKDSGKGTLCIPFVMGKCTNGDSCFNWHPDEEGAKKSFEILRKRYCKYGLECRRQACVFMHDDRSFSNPAPWRKEASRNTVCRYGLVCKDPNCKFVHTSSSSQARPALTNQWSGAGVETFSKFCRYGAECRISNCRFKHPDGTF